METVQNKKMVFVESCELLCVMDEVVSRFKSEGNGLYNSTLLAMEVIDNTRRELSKRLPKLQDCLGVGS